MKQSKRQQRLEAKRRLEELALCMQENEDNLYSEGIKISLGRPITCEEDIRDMFLYMEKLHKMETDTKEMQRMIKMYKEDTKTCQHLVFNCYKEKDYIQWVCHFISDEQIKFMGEKNYL